MPVAPTMTTPGNGDVKGLTDPPKSDPVRRYRQLSGDMLAKQHDSLREHRSIHESLLNQLSRCMGQLCQSHTQSDRYHERFHRLEPRRLDGLGPFGRSPSGQRWVHADARTSQRQSGNRRRNEQRPYFRPARAAPNHSCAGLSRPTRKRWDRYWVSRNGSNIKMHWASAL